MHAPRLAALLVVLCVAGPFINSGHVPEIVDAVYGGLVAWVALLTIALGVRHGRPVGTAWPLLMASVALGAASVMLPSIAGEGVQSAAPQIGEGHLLLSAPPAPHIGDVTLLLSALLFAAATLRILVARERRLFVVLDMLTIVVAVGLVAGLLLIGPAFTSSTVPLATRLMLVAHAVVDIIVLSASIHLLLGRRPLLSATRLVGAAGAAFVASEVLWNWLTLAGSYSPGLWADTGWNLQPLLLGLAALHPSMRQLGERADGGDELRRTTAVLLGIAALVGPLLIGVQDLHDQASHVVVAWLGGAVVSIIVVARFSLLLQRTRSLAAALHDDLAERGRLLLDFKDRYRELVERVPAVIYETHVDEAGVLFWHYVSPQCSAIFGIDAETLYANAESWWACVHDEDRAAAKAGLVHRGDRCSTATEFRFVRPDGEEIWLRDTATTVCGDGAGCRVQGLMFDITAAKTAEADRERMELELRLAQKLESVGQLATGIAHEINTPIQFVGDSIGFLERSFCDLMQLVEVYGELQASVEHGAPARELIERVSEARFDADVEYLAERVPAAFERTLDGVRRVATIVRAMRDFGHPTTDVTAVDINEALGNTLIVATNEYKYVADVTCDTGTLPAVVCNRGDINQVLLNLIVNAAHAIADAVGDSGKRGAITIRTAAQDDTVRISIADTGTGIPAEIAARIYDPFFTTKPVGRGTGQGLAITRSIVERHDGTITFDTVAGAGTTFHITLPINGHAAESELQEVTA